MFFELRDFCFLPESSIATSHHLGGNFSLSTIKRLVADKMANAAVNYIHACFEDAMTVSQIVGLIPVSRLLDPQMAECSGSSVVAGCVGIDFCSLAGLS